MGFFIGGVWKWNGAYWKAPAKDRIISLYAFINGECHIKGILPYHLIITENADSLQHTRPDLLALVWMAVHIFSVATFSLNLMLQPGSAFLQLRHVFHRETHTCSSSRNRASVPIPGSQHDLARSQRCSRNDQGDTCATPGQSGMLRASLPGLDFSGPLLMCLSGCSTHVSAELQRKRFSGDARPQRTLSGEPF